MNPAMKSKWISALRYGDYSQAQGALRTGGKFCCLGVLCDLDGPEEWVSGFDGMCRFRDNTGMLPNDLLDAAELTRLEEGTLMSMNDEGISFAEIAQWIEDNL